MDNTFFTFGDLLRDMQRNKEVKVDKNWLYRNIFEASSSLSDAQDLCGGGDFDAHSPMAAELSAVLRLIEHAKRHLDAIAEADHEAYFRAITSFPLGCTLEAEDA